MKYLPAIFILVFILISPRICGSSNLGDSAKFKENPNYNLQIEMYDIYKTRQADIVMFGNSLTHGANWNELVGRKNIVERGIPSDITEGMLNRIDYILRLKPKVVFILAGLNDIYQWIPTEIIYTNYVRIISLLKSKNITPVIQSTLYAGSEWGKDWNLKPSDNANRNVEVDRLNSLLRSYAERNQIEFIELNEKMSDGNFLNSNLTYDGVHLNGKGFRIWGNEVEKVLIKHGL